MAEKRNIVLNLDKDQMAELVLALDDRIQKHGNAKNYADPAARHIYDRLIDIVLRIRLQAGKECDLNDDRSKVLQEAIWDAAPPELWRNMMEGIEPWNRWVRIGWFGAINTLMNRLVAPLFELEGYEDYMVDTVGLGDLNEMWEDVKHADISDS